MKILATIIIAEAAVYAKRRVERVAFLAEHRLEQEQRQEAHKNIQQEQSAAG